MHRADGVEGIGKRGGVLGDALALAGSEGHTLGVDFGKFRIVSAAGKGNVALSRMHNGLEKSSSRLGSGGRKVETSFQDHGAHFCGAVWNLKVELNS